MPDNINHPRHYTAHPSGVECIQITRHMSFNLGNAFKYIWRADLKHDDGGLEDLKKAMWYLQDEIAKREKDTARAEAERQKVESFGGTVDRAQWTQEELEAAGEFECANPHLLFVPNRISPRAGPPTPRFLTRDENFKDWPEPFTLDHDDEARAAKAASWG